MKTIEIFIGSPRKNGNTAAMADMLCSAAEGEYRLSVNYLYDIDISHCIDCRRCLAGKLICPIADDMQLIYSKLDAADVIVFGTPLYWYGPSAAAKLMLDRLRPYYRNKGLKGKSLALLIPAADGPPDCDLTIEMFKRSAALLGMKFAGAVTAKAFDIGELTGNEQTEKAINELFTGITAAE